MKLGNTKRYLVGGFLFGFLFPIFSWILDGFVFHNLAFEWNSILKIHVDNPIHFIIDSAPFVLGIAFGLTGYTLDEDKKNKEKHQKDTQGYNRDNKKLVRRMRTATFIAPVFVFVFMLISLLVLQNFISKQQNDAVAITISGRQRMLSQRIAKNAISLTILKDEQRVYHFNSLNESLVLFKDFHQNLTKKSNTLGFDDNYQISENIQNLYDSLEPFYNGLIGGANLLLEANQFSDSTQRSEKQFFAFNEIDYNEKNFLPIMNTIVFAYEQEGQEKVAKLRFVQAIIAVLFVLFVLALVVFGLRPMISRVETAFFDIEEAKNELTTQNEELQASEEEIRQNVEKLQTINDTLFVAQRETAEKQKQLQSLSDNLQGIMFRTQINSNWTMEFISNGVEKLIGYKAEEFLEGGIRSFVDTIYEKDNYIEEQINSAIENKTSYQIEYRLKHKNENLIWVEETATPIFDNTGEAIYIDGVIMDISSRKEAEQMIEKQTQKLKEQQQLSQDAEKMAKMGSYTLNLMTDEVKSSENLPLIYGFPKNKIITRRTFTEITHPEDLIENRTELEKAIEQKSSELFVHYRARNEENEEWKYYQSFSFLKYDNQGNPIALVGTVQDVTEEVLIKKTMEEILLDASQNKDMLDEAQRLARIVSYDMDIYSSEIRWSSSFREVFDVALKDIPTTTEDFQAWIEDEDKDKASAGWAKAITEKANFDETYRIYTPKEERIYVRERGYPVFNENGSPIFMRGTLQDITKTEIIKKEIERKSKIIERQNTKFVASVNYAQRIQSAMLGGTQEIKSVFKDAFIFFEPKDIVSGDFYWYAQLDEHRKVVMVGDCTGHGVPGAFMSLLGTTILNEIVLQRQITTPSKILNELQIEIKQILNQENTGNKDGMDAAIVVVNKSLGMLEFAGAKNPLIYIHKKRKRGGADTNLTLIKGDNLSIGGRNEKISTSEYTNHIVNLENVEAFYLYSDGFQDQFGGEIGRKFMSSKFRELLYNTHSTSMRHQRVALKRTLMNWMGTENEQIDDICVVGITV